MFFSPKRAQNFSDVPTTEEATGHKWHKGRVARLCRPKGLPKEIAAQYETVIKQAWDNDEFKAFMNRRGFDTIYLEFSEAFGVHEGGQRGQRQGAEVARAGNSKGPRK